MAGLSVERTDTHEFVGRNDRGAEVRIGRAGAPGSFSPGELLQLAAAGCAVVTVEELVTRRAGDEARLAAAVTADRSPAEHRYDALGVVLQADLSFLDDDARGRVEAALHTAIEAQCTVSRTIEHGAPVGLRIETIER